MIASRLSILFDLRRSLDTRLLVATRRNSPIPSAAAPLFPCSDSDNLLRRLFYSVEEIQQAYPTLQFLPRPDRSLPPVLCAMASACVLLDRTVTFCDHPNEPDPFRGGGEEAVGVVGATTAALFREPLSLEAREAAVAKYLRAMKPDLQLVDPPGVSLLTMVRPLSSDPIPKYGRGLPSGFVAAADNNLVLLYAGSYRPASSYRGCYLLFDAASCSLSTIPGIHYMDPYTCGGHGTVIVARGGGAFVLAELLFSFRRWEPSLAMLCLWNSSPSDQQRTEWVYKVGQLPAQVCLTWKVHMSFPVQSRNLLCWTDLLHGLLLCDLESHCDEADTSLDMSFVPLPSSCSISEQHNNRRRLLNPQDFRTMACVDGVIKFLTMDGFMEGRSISLHTYSLDLDRPSPSWTLETVLHLDNLWADATFVSTGVPRITPLFPTLSTQEHGIVYLVIPGDVEESEEGFKSRRAQLLLSVDTRKAKVISATQQNRPRTLLGSRYTIAFQFRWSSEYHQRAVEAIGMGAGGKRVKFE